MSKRFQKIFISEKNVCAEGCPVMISAGALTRDLLKDVLYAQLRFRNIGSEAIERFSVRLTFMNARKKAIGSSVSHVVVCGNLSSFGITGKEVAFIAPKEAESFAASIENIRYANGKDQNFADAEWEALPPQKLIETEIGAPEQRAQYRNFFGASAKYVPYYGKNVWLCTCGFANAASKDCCMACGSKQRELKAVDEEILCGLKPLPRDCSEEAEEKEKPLLRDKVRAVNPPLPRKTKLKIFFAALISVLLLFGVSFATTYAYFVSSHDLFSEISENQLLSSAKAQMKRGRYKEAKELLKGIKNDPEKLALICDYMVTGKYSEAVKLGWTTVVLPDSVTKIPDGAFQNTGLVSITVPAGVTEIGSEAFSGCTKLQEINYRGTESQWNKIKKGVNWAKGVSCSVYVSS